jgi:hypothetical protein
VVFLFVGGGNNSKPTKNYSSPKKISSSSEPRP